MVIISKQKTKSETKSTNKGKKKSRQQNMSSQVILNRSDKLTKLTCSPFADYEGDYDVRDTVVGLD